MDYNQTSFSGGMNLLVDDTRVQPNEYREAFNVRNRFDVLDQILVATLETGAPAGLKQGLFTFGDYLLLFVSGQAWWRFRDNSGWNLISGFTMSATAPRMYVEVVPVNTTNYGRISQGVTISSVLTATAESPINLINVAASFGNPSGILVQDGVTQPFFIWVNQAGIQCRQTQQYSDWMYDPTGVADKREYVPIGTVMAWMNGVLFLLAPDGATILRSVSGRPLDFVINVDLNGVKGGDAYTTAYSVGVGGITCMKALSSGGLFVAAGNIACFVVTFNTTPGALQVFGEYTFIRQSLFSAGCVNDKVFIDILGDSAFVDLEGLRSFNAVLQLQNEGRNSIFSLKVSKLFKGIIQDSLNTSAIVYDNYALFGVDTIYGPVILVFDTLTQTFSSIDTVMGGVAVKQFAKIDTDVTRLYCIGDDDNVYQLYNGTDYAISTVRFGGLCSQDPATELQPNKFRCVLSGYRQDSSLTCTAFVNNRLSGDVMTKPFRFVPSSIPYTGTPALSDVDSQVSNVMFNWTGANQGWKMFHMLTWTGGGSVTNVKTSTNDITPSASALKAQAVQV